MVTFDRHLPVMGRPARDLRMQTDRASVEAACLR
jgi:hypothetical protein